MKEHRDRERERKNEDKKSTNQIKRRTSERKIAKHRER